MVLLTTTLGTQEALSVSTSTRKLDRLQATFVARMASPGRVSRRAGRCLKRLRAQAEPAGATR
jgi:hypothetical protein